MATLRTDETYKRYKDLIAAGGLEHGCALCDAPALKTFNYWKVIHNAFPYDRIADVHNMVVPLRHASEAEVTQDEWAEYQTIKGDYIQKEYEFIIEATIKMKSIPAHFHVHVITLK